MTPNGPKVREALLHVIHETDQRGFRFTQFEISKSVFLADRSHLNRYGRPITFDQYIAMLDGPVPSLAYDILKDQPGAKREAGISVNLWKKVPAGGRKFHYYDAVRDATDELMSPSDLEELSSAVSLVREWGYDRTWQHVHDDAAYVNAWPKRGSGLQYPMDIALLFDVPNEERANTIRFYAQNE